MGSANKTFSLDDDPRLFLTTHNAHTLSLFFIVTTTPQGHTQALA